MIINSKQWKMITQEVHMSKGKLITVEISPGRSVKMYEADAIAKGLIQPPPEVKMRKAPGNKMRERPADKTGQRIETDQRMVSTDAGSHDPQTVIAEIAQLEDEAPPHEEQPGLDSIAGIGKASSRALAAHGVETFEQLKAAQDLDYLPAKVLTAIAKWRSERG